LGEGVVNVPRNWRWLSADPSASTIEALQAEVTDLIHLLDQPPSDYYDEQRRVAQRGAQRSLSVPAAPSAAPRRATRA
jgi:hypothetical protein